MTSSLAPFLPRPPPLGFVAAFSDSSFPPSGPSNNNSAFPAYQQQPQ